MAADRRTVVAAFCFVGFVVGSACGSQNGVASPPAPEPVTFVDSGGPSTTFVGNVAMAEVENVRLVGESKVLDLDQQTYRAEVVSYLVPGALGADRAETIDVYEVVYDNRSHLEAATKASGTIVLVLDVKDPDLLQSREAGASIALNGAFSVSGTVADPQVVQLPGRAGATDGPWNAMIRAAGPEGLELSADAPAVDALVALMNATLDGRPTPLDGIIDNGGEAPPEAVPGDNRADVPLDGEVDTGVAESGPSELDEGS